MNKVTGIDGGIMSTEVKGWVNARRIVGGIVFLEVIPSVSIKPVTVVVKKSENPEAWKIAKRIKVGSAVRVYGEYVLEGKSKRGKEFIPSCIEVLSTPRDALPYDPLGKTPVLFDTKIKYRYLMLRTPKERALFRIRATLLKYARRFLEEKGFLEVQTPKIVGAGAEGGATLFKLDYFGRQAFLAQSPQLYKQMLMSSLTGVYEITPYFRAEQHHTTRHLNESWGIDVEMGFIEGMEDVMKVLEELVIYVIKNVRNECSEELEQLGVDLTVPRTPVPRISYEEALNLLEKEGCQVKWGLDLSDRDEKKLGEIMLEKGYELYFITNYPWAIKPFYVMREGAELSRSFDLDYRGIEICSGGQREHRYDRLIENMKVKGLNPEDFNFYLDAFKYGMPPHGGFGLGVERLLMKMLRAENIREVILFVRDIHRLVP